MRFIALLWKELQEIGPLALAGAAVMAVIGGLLMYEEARNRRVADNWRMGTDSVNRVMMGDVELPGSKDGMPGMDEPYGYSVQAYALVKDPPLHSFGPLLFWASCGSGLLFAGRQYLYPLLTKTLTFTLHRSMSRLSILLTKFAAAGIGLVAACGVTWCLFVLYAARPGVCAFPADKGVLAEGIGYLLGGPVIYLGCVLSILSRTRWYGTKALGVAVAVGGAWMIAVVVSVLWSVVVFAVACMLLLPQVVHVWCSRDY